VQFLLYCKHERGADESPFVTETVDELMSRVYATTTDAVVLNDNYRNANAQSLPSLIAYAECLHLLALDNDAGNSKKTMCAQDVVRDIIEQKLNSLSYCNWRTCKRLLKRARAGAFGVVDATTIDSYMQLMHKRYPTCNYFCPISQQTTSGGDDTKVPNGVTCQQADLKH